MKLRCDLYSRSQKYCTQSVTKLSVYSVFHFLATQSFTKPSVYSVLHKALCVLTKLCVYSVFRKAFNLFTKLIIIVVIVKLKGAIQDCLQSPHCSTNCLQVARTQSCANYLLHTRAFIMYNMACATWYKGTAQLLRLAEFKSHLFYIYFIG